MSQPSLAKLRFLSSFEEPSDVWRKCISIQDKWKKQLSYEEKYAEEMHKFRKMMAVKSLCITNVLEDTLPQEFNETSAEEELTKAYRDDDKIVSTKSESRLSQLAQHVQAYKYLCDNTPTSQLLTEDLIKKAHGIMMCGLKNEDGMSIHAGCYRTISVYAGDHVFPSFECVPSNMTKIVEEYNDKYSCPHDPFELASWLHFNIVSLHPFEDGNGRISRLLWCFSLMRDGLPFPAVLTSGHKRSQKHLVLCLNRDRDRLLMNDNPHMTTLTVVSVLQAWQKFSEHCHMSLDSLIE